MAPGGGGQALDGSQRYPEVCVRAMVKFSMEGRRAGVRVGWRVDEGALVFGDAPPSAASSPSPPQPVTTAMAATARKIATITIGRLIRVSSLNDPVPTGAFSMHLHLKG